MLFVVQDGLSRPRLYRPARPRVLYTRPPRSIPHNEPVALRQLQRRHPHQPPRYQSGALLLHELCRRVQPRGCITDLTPEDFRSEPVALRQLQRRHPHQPPRYQSGALLLHELCRRVQPRGCITDLTPEDVGVFGESFLQGADAQLPPERPPWLARQRFRTAEVVLSNL